MLRDARYIALEGPIAVGKTALASVLAEESGARLIREPAEENPFLPRFYEDPERFGFTAQVSFLMERYRQQQDLRQIDLFQRATVTDYIFAKDRIFAELVLTNDEMALYERIYGLLDARVRKPDLVVFLDAKTEVLLKRLKRRKRPHESFIGRDYMERLVEAYRRFFHAYTDTPLLVVNTSDIDFVDNGGDRADLVREIGRMGQGVQHYVPLGSG
jgi:deoxyguanosine kinase